MRRILRGAGYKVLEGTDYGEAIAMHHQNRGKIDLLVTDVSLPGKDGYMLANALLDTDPGLKVIFISGHVGAEICRYYGMATSDIRFLRKPFTAVDLLMRVRQLLENGEPLCDAAVT
jgi:DNA-binding response OmpR family regulator